MRRGKSFDRIEFYQTYTICLEDNNLQPIFLTTKVKPKKNCPEDDISTSKLCPNGCYMNEENDQLNISNNTIEDMCQEQNVSSSTPDDTLLNGYDINLQEDDNKSLSSDYYLTFNGKEFLINGQQKNIEDKGEENSSTVGREKRSVSVLQFPESGLQYDLEDRFGEDMIILKRGEKFHVTGPEQYQLLLKGYFTDFGTDDKMKKVRQQFDPPCEELHVGTNFRHEKGREYKVEDFNQNGKFDENETGLYLDLDIRNTNPVFQIIENGQSFTLEGCFAGIGGFVGIFIGLSLRQLPQIFLQFIHFIQKAMK